jgi:hypothetical protein
VTNPPFNLLWEMPFAPCEFGMFDLKAVAVDDLGATTESAPVVVHQVCGRPPLSVLEIVSPADGAVFAAPATFEFKAEILASGSGSALVEFYIGTNLVQRVMSNMTATGPPVSITVSNLPKGEYKLTLRDRYSICVACDVQTNTVRVVDLGIDSPRLTPDGRLQFEVVTAFSGRETLIQSASDLLNWSPLRTNVPSSNTFTFTESSPATNAQRFYRVFVPPE